MCDHCSENTAKARIYLLDDLWEKLHIGSVGGGGEEEKVLKMTSCLVIFRAFFLILSNYIVVVWSFSELYFF